MIHIVLCGGSGVRLWPLSRISKPKQFISFLDDQSLLQKTIVGNRFCAEECFVVCNADHFHMVKSQLSECGLSPGKYFLEPVPKNTAAAVCFGLLACRPEEIVLITPADHDIDYSSNYVRALEEAEEYAENDEVVLFGIAPATPETGYGYIEVNQDYSVKKFHEKPSVELAREYLKDGRFFWNSGMICAKAGKLIEQFQKYAKDILEGARSALMRAKIREEDGAKVYAILKDEMEIIPADSIDYAILEKASHLKCVVGNFRWTDMGSFDSIFTSFPKNDGENVVNAKSFVSVNAKNNLVMGTDRLISMVDVEDLAVVDTPDALLISKLGSTQKVKELVGKLKTTNTKVHEFHFEETRPWGTFSVLESRETWKVKRLVIWPGKRLSLQKHMNRSEHWVVVAGKALVTVGSEQRELYANQSIYIPMEEQHRIENPGEENLVIIEVQSGAYTGEDDIVRIEDDFHRVIGS